MSENASRPLANGRLAGGGGLRWSTPRPYDTTRPSSTQELRADATGKVVAVISGGVLRKAVSASHHFLRVPPAIAFDTSILDAARQAGVSRVEVTDRETGRVYTAALADFDRWGVPINRGFGEQRALPLARWQVTRPGEGRQLALWGAERCDG